MDVQLPRTLGEALHWKASRPDAVPIAGGTDLMVDLNFDRSRPEAILDISRIPELLEWRREDGAVFLGAGVTYARIMRELPELTSLVEASRTIGSPQIRNRATVGGNLGTASPAGDALPVLAAYDASVVVSSERGTRELAWNEFLTGPKNTAIEPDEVILGSRWRAVRGPGSFSKIGTRNAMVISVAGLCLQLDEDAREVRVALGSVGPTILRVADAESFAAEAMERLGTWDDPVAPVGDEVLGGFAERVAAGAQPIDDVRGSEAYRRHACGVLAKRSLSWALGARRG
jgi:CO/xanthine dehydrogenase FAD-binding subunit